MSTGDTWLGGTDCNRGVLRVLDETLHHVGERYSLFRLESRGDTLAIFARTV